VVSPQEGYAMGEVAMPYDGSEPTASSRQDMPIAPKPANTQNPAAHDFWRTFRVFSSSFEEFCIRRWYVFLIAFFAILLIVNILVDVDYGLLLKRGAFYFFANQGLPPLFLSPFYFILFLPLSEQSHQNGLIDASSLFCYSSRSC
jgi:hypothetical protein